MSTSNFFQEIHLSNQPSKNDDQILADTISWVNYCRDSVKTVLSRKALGELSSWNIDENKNIKHSTGQFFSIQGLEHYTSREKCNFHYQPIILQPEIGILGFLCSVVQGKLQFLIQAKIEPGNINTVQLSPTVQATRSNYLKAHKGASPAFIEYFDNNNQPEILVDILQSEQGDRFYKKRNRNMIVYTNKLPKTIPTNFRWLTLHQIKLLMKTPNLVNMDSRTVIASLCANLLAYPHKRSDLLTERHQITIAFDDSEVEPYLSLREINSKIINYKSSFRFYSKLIDIENLPSEWSYSDGLYKNTKSFDFAIVGLNIHISNREVTTWDQPIISPECKSVFAFIIKRINYSIHFLVQLKIEPGLIDLFELGPTVQIKINSEVNENSLSPEHSFYQYIQKHKLRLPYTNIMQSEEGGRFLFEENENIIMYADDSFNLAVPENYLWMTYDQIMYFINLGGLVNIQARSLIATLLTQSNLLS